MIRYIGTVDDKKIWLTEDDFAELIPGKYLIPCARDKTIQEVEEECKKSKLRKKKYAEENRLKYLDCELANDNDEFYYKEYDVIVFDKREGEFFKLENYDTVAIAYPLKSWGNQSNGVDLKRNEMQEVYVAEVTDDRFYEKFE